MPTADGHPDLAVEQAPAQLQNLVAGCNAFLASLSNSKDALDAAQSSTMQTDNAMVGSQLDAALDQATSAQQQLADSIDTYSGETLNEDQSAAVDATGESLERAATELRQDGEISAETRTSLERNAGELRDLIRGVENRLEEAKQPLPANATDAQVVSQMVATDAANAQLQSLTAASQLAEAAAGLGSRTAAEAAANIVQQAAAEADARDALEVEKRVEERMAREGKQ